MAKNLKTICKDIADAIRTVKNSEDLINPQDFSEEILSISGGSTAVKWTGHADAEGLRAIGWTDEDIAYYQANGVNWNEEDDEYHKVSDDNKALYGVLTYNNIYTYKDRIIYLPKIDTHNVTNMESKFSDCLSLVGIPQLDTHNVTSMSRMFYNCFSLVSIPHLDTHNVTSMGSMFYDCNSLVNIPQLDTHNVTSMNSMFYDCNSLVGIPHLDTQNVTGMVKMFNGCLSLVGIPQLDTSKVTSMNEMFYDCRSLVSIPQLDTQNVTSIVNMFSNCNSLIATNIKNVKLSYPLRGARNLSKESLLYIINNEAATSAITISLHSNTYSRLANDADIVAALANHPNVSLAQ